VRSGHTETLDGNGIDSIDESAFVSDKTTLKEGALPLRLSADLFTTYPRE